MQMQRANVGGMQGALLLSEGQVGHAISRSQETLHKPFVVHLHNWTFMQQKGRQKK